MMNTGPMPFFSAFPNVKLEDTHAGLMRYAVVERVTVNSSRSRMRIYLHSENWLKKTTVYAVESAIKEQIFGGADMEIRIIERFRLSSSYTPENFYKVYRTSMLRELKEVSPLLRHAFSAAELDFSEKDHVRVKVNCSVISEERRQQLASYIEKVFCDRAGFSGTDVTCEFEDAGTVDIFAEEDFKIREKVRRVTEQNAKLHQEKKEEKKLPSKEEKTYRRKEGLRNDPSVIYGRNFEEEPTEIASIGEDPREVTVRGEVFATETRETKAGRIIMTVSVTDMTDSMRFKLWFEKDDEAAFASAFKNGETFLIRGMMDFDPFDKEMMIRSVYGIKRTGSVRRGRADNSPVKRVELHCHTQMSDMDAVSPASAIVKQAYEFGMKALAITDHGVVQSFPEAYRTIGGKKGIPKDADFKILYGMEAYLVDDTKNLVSGEIRGSVHGDICVFQTVTTGLSPRAHEIIEISAQMIEGGKLTREFSTLVKPEHPIPFSIQTETGITDDMTASSPGIAEAVKMFCEFAGDVPLAAYDADMEMNFLITACRNAGIPAPGKTYIDIPSVSRYLLPSIGRIRFKTLIRHLKIPCSDEMRALPRAKSMALVHLALVREMEKEGIEDFASLNERGAVSADRIRNLPYYHAIILAKNETGRRNLYTLVSESHLNYFKRRPRVPRSVLNAHREGLILGSACSAGELYIAVMNDAPDAEIGRIVNYYDYLEIQPVANNEYMVREQKNGIKNDEDLREINRRIVRLGEEYGKPVCATCDVHFLNPEDWIYRAIIQAGNGYGAEASVQPPLYLRTTEEMLEEFAYLGDKKSREVVITNTNLIADMIENISPIYPDKCPPSIPHSDEDLHDICYETA
ncbi:MAG: PHP domain-containing protein, partial [Lachnospiraceae bacterium]|nr:PHP domain-containing protein [Lachnospiraceae bacterium]